MTNKTEIEYRTKTVVVGNVAVTIHRPVLSDKERERVENVVRTALSHYGRTVCDGKTN